MKKIKKYFLPFFLVLLSIFESIAFCTVFSFAATNVSSSDIIKYILTSDGFALSESVYQSLFGSSNISDSFDSWEEGHSGAGYSRGYDEFYNDNVTTDSDGNVSTSTEFNNFIYDTTTNYVLNNPLDYKLVRIPSYREYNKDWIVSFDFWQYLVDSIVAKNKGSGYVLITQIGQGGSFPQYGVDMIHIPDTSYFGLYGTVTGDFFTNVKPIYKWNSSNKCLNVDDNNLLATEIVSVYNPTITPNVTPSAIFWGVNQIYNDTNVRANHTWTIVSATKESQYVYVFSSPTAYKNFDSGSPQSYYTYNPSNVAPTSFTSSDMANSNNVYSVITSNVTSGLSGDEVNEIIKTALEGNLSSGGGSGGGSGGHTWESITDMLHAVGDFFAAIINGIAEALRSIIDALTGVVQDIIQFFTSDDGSIISLLTTFVSWLPEPIPQLLIALFVLSVLFGVIKLIKGVFS